MSRALLCTIIVVALGNALCAENSTIADIFGLDLVLLDSVANKIEDTDRGFLNVYLRRVDGQWQQSTALGYNSGFHPGRVVESSVTATAITLKLAITMASDPWTPGGMAWYTITLNNTNGSWTGTHQGTFRSIPVHGRVTTEIHPPYQRLRPAAGLREHPRLLFCKADLPALQAKAKTPFGQAAILAMQDAAGAALKFRLTEDRTFADESRSKVEALMADKSSGDKGVAHRVWSWRAEEIAIAFDLCYEVWPDDFKATVASYLAKVAVHAFFNHGSFTEYTSWGLTSRHAPNLLYGPALAGLAILGEPEALPIEPPTYLGGHDPTVPLPALTTVPDGLPIVPFSDGVMPDRWLFAGPLKREAGEDPLPAAGGPGLLPNPGDALSVKAGSVAWTPLPAAGLWEGQLNVTGANKHAYFTFNSFATVVDFPGQQWIRFDAGLSNAIDTERFYLDACPLTDGDILLVAPGKHRLLLDLRMRETNPWGKITMRPRFSAVDATTASAGLTAFQDNAQERHAAWMADRDYQNKNQGASARFQHLFVMGESLMYAYYRHAIGDGGFQVGAANPLFNSQGPMRYAGPYRMMFGHDVSSHADITAFLPRRLMPFAYPAQGKPLVQSINGDATFDLLGWFERRDGGPEYFALLYPLASPAYQPAILWAWNRHVEVDGPADIPKLAKVQGMRGGPSLDTFPVYAFVHYPLGKAAKKPGDCLPLTWEAPYHGWYCFRNRWQDQDDAVVQVFAKTRDGGDNSTENAGAWRVLALGKEWIIGPQRFVFDGSMSFDGARGMESVVILPDHPQINARACGKVTWNQGDSATGSGSVTIDLSQVYASANPEGKGLYTRYGSVLLEKNLKDIGLSGRRAFAVDFSGKSGAPVLLAVLDEVRGQTKSLWLHQLESMTELWGHWEILGPDDKPYKPSKDANGKFSPSPWLGSGKLAEGFKLRQNRDPKISEIWKPSVNAKVELTATTFTVAKDDASLQAVFAPTEGLEIKEQVVSSLNNVFNGHTSGVLRIASYAITAQNQNGQYFTVMTVQRGPAPKVTVEGQGILAKFTIGTRTVHWDGTKIVIE